MAPTPVTRPFRFQELRADSLSGDFVVKIPLPMRLNYTPRTLRAGMTLMEVLIATAILVFGVVAVLAVVMSAQRTHQRATDETIAVQVAQSIMAEWRELLDKGGFKDGSIPPSTDPKTPFDQLKGHVDYPDYHYAVKYAEIYPTRGSDKSSVPVGREYLVEVHVFWLRQGGTRSVVFRTIMLHRGG
jgi:type II secretory pathway pseudopilin PulG